MMSYRQISYLLKDSFRLSEIIPYYCCLIESGVSLMYSVVILKISLYSVRKNCIMEENLLQNEMWEIGTDTEAGGERSGDAYALDTL